MQFFSQRKAFYLNRLLWSCHLSIINLFNVFHFFILYIFPHHISLVTISVSVYMLFIFYQYTQVFKTFVHFCWLINWNWNWNNTCNKISIVQCAQFYKAIQTRDHMAFKTTSKYPQEQFVIVIDLSLRPPA